MIAENIKIALRSLSKNRSYTAINVIGLATGIAACLLIFRMVWYELGFNKNFKNYGRIVRVVTTERDPSGEEEFSACIPIPAMTAMQQTVPQFEQFARIREIWPTLTVPNPAGGPALKKFAPNTPEIAFFVEPSFVQIFDFEWLNGDPATALSDVGTVVLTKTMAEKCFGSPAAALGQTVTMDNHIQLAVRGVVADPPRNCDFPFLYLVSYKTLEANTDYYFYDRIEWGSCSSNNQAYALLQDPGQWQAASAALATVGEKEYTERDGKRSKTHRLQALADLHHNEDIGHSGSHIVSKNRLWVLTSIGLLILVMACFNFINLATALAAGRAREVGVRKTLGSSRGQLIAQFMTETVAIVLFSVMLGSLVAAACAPLLQHISEVPTDWPFFSEPAVWAFLGTATVSVSMLSGIYPSLVLAGFQPTRAFRKDNSEQVGGVSVRKVLVVGQFAIAQALIVGTLVTISQLDYIQKMDLGFSKDLIYNFSFASDSASQSKLDVLKLRLSQLPAVEMVTFGSDRPASGNTWSSNFGLGRGSNDAPFNTSLKFCDADFQRTYGLKLVAGRWLEPSDTMREVVVNETMLRKLGVSPEEALQKELRLGGRRHRPVVGVVKDFHSHSVHSELEALTMTTRREFYGECGLKIRPDRMAEAAPAIQKIFDETFPEQVFSGNWYDESIARFYRDENRFSATCKGFAVLAVLIACLGLLGLAAHAAARRTKEIGIRKVLGASVAGITGLLAKDFLKLVIVAIVIASPVAYYFMQKWLADFVYRIEIQWWVFAGAGLAAVAIAFLTVSYQSVKAALSNPVKSLRNE